MIQAVDSFGVHTPLSAKALAAAGIRFAARYHYNTSRAEVATLHAAGVGFVLIGEFDTRTWHPPIDSPETGPDHARKAVAVAQAIGYPRGAAIYFTQDTDLTPGQYERALSYWDGGDDIVRAAGYRVGAYGEATFIDLLIDRGKADLAWQAGADSWAGYQTSRHACFRQLPKQATFGGVTCDLNNIQRDDCGAWMPGGAQQPPEDDVTLEELNNALAAWQPTLVDATAGKVLDRLGNQNGDQEPAAHLPDGTAVNLTTVVVLVQALPTIIATAVAQGIATIPAGSTAVDEAAIAAAVADDIARRLAS